MKETFQLKYKSLEKANVKYRDPLYNEKRLWVSRLLAQFLIEDAVIISIDESNFRHDALPLKQWQFNQQSIAPKSRLPSKRKREQGREKVTGIVFTTDAQLEPQNEHQFTNLTQIQDHLEVTLEDKQTYGNDKQPPQLIKQDNRAPHIEREELKQSLPS